MRTLPVHEHLPSRAAAWWLLGAAPVLWAVDVAIHKYAWEQRAFASYAHMELARLAVGVCGLGLLLAARRARPEDAGVTLGRPRVTFFYVGAVSLAAAVVSLVGLGLGLLFIWATGWKVPMEWLQPISMRHPSRFWSEVWHWSVMAPLIEEPLYRGLPAAALERVGGRWVAVVVLAVVWAALHYLYGWGPIHVPYYLLFWGAFMTWVYLRTHSLATTILLHAGFNFVGPVLSDLVLLEYGDVIRQTLGK